MDAFYEKSMEVVIRTYMEGMADPLNEVKLKGLAMEATIEKLGLPDFNKATVKVWGINRENMHYLTELAHRWVKNKGETRLTYEMEIKAGKEPFGVIPESWAKSDQGVSHGKLPGSLLAPNEPLATVFVGDVVSAHADFSSAPEVFMVFDCKSGVVLRQAQQKDLSVGPGGMMVSEVFAQILEGSGLDFRNEAEEFLVPEGTVFEGSPIKKALDLANQFRRKLILDNKQMILTERVRPRQNVEAVYVSSTNGMIGYPALNNSGIKVSTLFNDMLCYSGLIRIERSLVPLASDTWRITKLTHHLAAYKTGKWQSDVEATYVDAV